MTQPASLASMDLVTYRVIADADAQLPLRLLAPLTRSDLLPVHFQMSLAEDAVRIDIAISRADSIDPERFAEALRRVVGVRTVMARM